MKPIVAVVPVALFLSGTAMASPGEHLEEAFDHVGATEEQRTTVQEILDVAIPQMKAFHEEGRELKEEVRDLFHTSDEIDRVALEDVRMDIVDLFDRATAAAFGHLADVSEVFSLDQRDQLRELREQRHDKLRERWTHLRG